MRMRCQLLRKCLSVTGLILWTLTSAHAEPEGDRGRTAIETPPEQTEAQLIKTIEGRAPTIASVLRHNEALNAELGADKYLDALKQVARLVADSDAECQAAVRIIGDTVERTTANVGKIQIDGHPAEWDRMLPPPASCTWRWATTDRAREVWEHGVAAVVRDGWIYVMAGIADESYFRLPHARIVITVDCLGDRTWDVSLVIWQEKGRWSGQCDFMSGYGSKRPSIPVDTLAVKVGKVVEVAMDIGNFAPPERAKSIWNINLRCRTVTHGRTMWPRTMDLPVFNETAAPGVAAEPYVRNLMFLAADEGLEQAERTAAAIAIMAATIYATHNNEVRTQLRRDNARLLRFARATIEWQRGLNTDYRLDEYPVEAQLAWANRLIWLGLRYLSWHNKYNRVGDLENYRWSFVGPDTLEELRAIAQREGLIAQTVAQTAANIDRWVSSKMVNRSYIGHVHRAMEQAKNDPKAHAELKKQYEELKALRDSGAATLGHFKGQPVYQVFARNTEAYLRLIKTEGHFYGGCPDQAWLCHDMLRAVGIAPLALGVSGRSGHCWAGHFDPSRRRWKSYQIGRDGPHKWFFSLDRSAVYPYAATACRADSKRKWQLFRGELEGRLIRKYTQRGIPTKIIRRWMLTPSW